MTQKDIELLIKDLSARLPYNVYVYFKTRYRCNAITDVLDGAIYTYIETHLLEDDGENEIDIIKPYLRPMSSITEEEAKEIATLHGLKNILSVKITDEYIDVIIDDGFNSTERITLWYDELILSIECFDWLSAHHFDYRGLIEKALALEAPEEMYKVNEK